MQELINKALQGDCLEVLKTFPDNYFDSLVTDPPAGISFMGKDFDKDKGGMLNWINWLSEVMNEAMRTMKPGALGLVWSIPRTSHWTGMALELAGFRLIDIIHVASGQGFPKGQDASKQIDQLLGEDREIVGVKIGKGGENLNKIARGNGNDNPQAKSCGAYGIGAKQINVEIPVSIPSSEEAKHWDGWKTPALKPSIEGWWLIQKPISESSIARNILKHEVGGINVEACRIESGKDYQKTERFNERKTLGGYGSVQIAEPFKPSSGRYPANLVLSCGANCDGENHSPDCPVTLFPETATSSSSPRKRDGSGSELGQGSGWNKHNNKVSTSEQYGDSGTAARYFKQLPFDTETIASIYYQAKASKRDRSCNGQVNNVHPTVKSRYLLEYFIKLITPPNGIVLDCFGGSGTTAIAAIENGFNYVLIEKEDDYFEIIQQRIAATLKTVEPTLEERVQWLETQVQAHGSKIKKLEAGNQQLSLFG